MSYESKAQQGYFHAAEARGEIPRKVVRDFDEATSRKQYARLPERVEHDARGGLAGRLAERYYGGGRAGEHHHGFEHDEREGSYMQEGGHDACQHFAHGGVSDRHDPGCPDHPMYQGGEAEDDRGEVEDQDYAPEDEAEQDEPPAPVPEPHELSRPSFRGSPLAARLARGLPRRFAQGGQAEDEVQVMSGSDWQPERNRARSPLAERLSGARLAPFAARRAMRAPASRVP